MLWSHVNLFYIQPADVNVKCIITGGLSLQVHALHGPQRAEPEFRTRGGESTRVLQSAEPDKACKADGAELLEESEEVSTV